ncbi:MAG: B12-binding domain-containing radical SAM protein [Dehalococcoidia bacterium]
MRISIISANRFRGPNPVLPIGPAIVAGTLRAHGHEVHLLDLCQDDAPEQAILSHLAAWEPDLVGVGLRNIENNQLIRHQSFLEEAERFVQAVKKATSSPILLGGSGYSLFPGEILERLDVPYGLAGDAEESVAALVDCIEKEVPADDVPGACYLSEGKAVVTGEAKVRRFAGLPRPAFDLLDCPRYLAEGAVMPIESKRGCDLACSYCSESADPEGARLRPPELTVAEIERIIGEMGTNNVFFPDGVFQHPPDHAMALCREITRRRLAVVWHTDVNPVGLSRELLEAMKETGCGGVVLGLEAATDEMLKSYRKGFTQGDIVRALDDLRAVGMPFIMSLLFGGPGETEESVWRALDFLNGVARGSPLMINVGLRVFKGTALEETARQEGRIAPGHNMLTPTYYLSHDLDEGLEDRLDEYCRDRPQWFTGPELQRRAQQAAGQ